VSRALAVGDVTRAPSIRGVFHFLHFVTLEPRLHEERGGAEGDSGASCEGDIEGDR
jgi:hypothetical protein